jgi:hypothetical protein
MFRLVSKLTVKTYIHIIHPQRDSIRIKEKPRKRSEPTISDDIIESGERGVDT